MTREKGQWPQLHLFSLHSDLAWRLVRFPF